MKVAGKQVTEHVRKKTTLTMNNLKLVRLKINE